MDNFLTPNTGLSTKAMNDLIQKQKRHRVKTQLPPLPNGKWTITYDLQVWRPHSKSILNTKIQLTLPKNLDDVPKFNFFNDKGWKKPFKNGGLSGTAEGAGISGHEKKLIVQYKIHGAPYMTLNVKPFSGKWYISLHTYGSQSGDHWRVIGSNQTFELDPEVVQSITRNTRDTRDTRNLRKSGTSKTKKRQEREELDKVLRLEKTKKARHELNDLIRSRKRVKTPRAPRQTNETGPTEQTVILIDT